MNFPEPQRTSLRMSVSLNATDIRIPDYAYKRGVTGSNPVAPTRQTNVVTDFASQAPSD